VAFLRRTANPGKISPIEFWLMVGVVVNGVAVITGIAVPTTLEQALPYPFRAVWALFMIGGGLSALAGWNSAGLYRVGLALVASGATTYGTALFLYGPSAFVAGVLNLSLAFACVFQVRQISRQLEAARVQLIEEAPSPPE
jgi:hypothetical protein